jgi:hypothetical protein
MTGLDRLRQLPSALPSDDSAVTFTRATLVALLDEDDRGAVEDEFARDMTVDEVAKKTGRHPPRSAAGSSSGRSVDTNSTVAIGVSHARLGGNISRGRRCRTTHRGNLLKWTFGMAEGGWSLNNETPCPAMSGLWCRKGRSRLGRHPTRP